VRKAFRRAEEEEKSRSGFSETGPLPRERTQEKSKL